MNKGLIAVLITTVLVVAMAACMSAQPKGYPRSPASLLPTDAGITETSVTMAANK